MTTKTNNLPNFQIYQDGEHIQAPVLERVASTAGTIAVTALQGLGRAVSRVVGECATHVELDLYDLQNGTNLRSEYVEQKRQLATMAMRERVGL